MAKRYFSAEEVACIIMQEEPDPGDISPSSSEPSLSSVSDGGDSSGKEDPYLSNVSSSGDEECILSKKLLRTVRTRGGICKKLKVIGGKFKQKGSDKTSADANLPSTSSSTPVPLTEAKAKKGRLPKEMRVGNILNINHQEHSKVWITDEKDPPGFNFDENVGFKVNIDSEEPKDYFGVFFTDTLVSLMVAQTNLYAVNVVNNARPLRRFSRMQKWEPVTVEEIRIFVGLTLLMGPIQLPTIGQGIPCMQ